MPSQLALILTLAFVAVLFIRDFRQKANVTGVLWLPFLWITVCGGGSRYFSQWLDMFGLHVGAITVEDGSPVDAAFNAGLILGGLIVLHKRRVSALGFIRNNQWLTIFLAYCLIAVVWSDFPFVSAKRWAKLLGDPVMALVLLTEPEPMAALARTMKRCAYVLLPVSILFIKYFPYLGRSYDSWNGMAMNTGIATNKNELGFDCWILGAVLFWHSLQVLQWERGRARREELIVCGGLMAMDLWLLKNAHSASSLVAFLLACGTMLFLGFRWVSKRHLSAYFIMGAVAAVAFSSLGLPDKIIHLLGRNDTLTGRTDIWQVLWQWPINPVVGTGFESFWLGDRRLEVQQNASVDMLNEAHNGYLETYLNLGFIGVVITAAMLLATYAKSRRALLRDFQFGRFRLAYLIAFLVYNWTESAFRMNAFPFFMFFVVAIDYPLRRVQVMVEQHPTDVVQDGTVFIAPRPQTI